MDETAIVEIYVDNVITETEEAILCDMDGNQIWIPKSQIHKSSEVRHEGDTGWLVLPEWLAIEKELV